MPCRAVFLLLVFIPVSAIAQQGDQPGEAQPPPAAHWDIPPSPALSIEDALASFRLVPGFRLEVVAAEPLVIDPVAMVFGPDGRIWVAEMRGYMPNVDGEGEDAAIGTIAVLEDVDGDGRMDRRTVFLDQLVLPRALAVVDGGLLVGEPPHLWYCRDTDGDGVADQKQIVSDDYGSNVNPEHTANGLFRGIDNWIYNANHTVRFRYQGQGKFTQADTITRGQWGITQNDTGQLFYNYNSSPLWTDVVPAHYLERNPDFGSGRFPRFMVVPRELPVWPGRITPGVNRGYKILRPDGTLPSTTAACGPVIYRGGRFPAAFHGDAFVAEPAGNLVKRIVLEEEKGVPIGQNAYEGAEFLTSTDERFRPVNLSNGPDGALYIVDMYRGIIQHRTYVTSYLRAQIKERDLERPLGLGRIYRVVPDHEAPRRPSINLATATTAALITALDDANGWVRDMAQQLLVERGDLSAVAALRQMAGGARATPLGRLHALWTLEGLSALDRKTVTDALTYADTDVVAAAMRLSEPWLVGTELDANLLSKLTRMSTRADLAPAIRLQLALSLGEVAGDAGLKASADLIRQAGSQPFVAEAVMTGIHNRELDLIDAISAEAPAGAVAHAIELAAATVLKSQDAERIDRIFHLLADESTHSATRSALLAGIARFIPKAAGNRTLVGRLPAEPRLLLEMAASSPTALTTKVATLLDQLTWPGKAAATTAAVVALTPEQQALFETGRTQYATLCAVCHQPDGEGMAGLAPGLVNSRWVLGPEEIVARIVLCGKDEAGVAMPPLRTLDDEAIAGALTFIRRSWGHEADPVSPATVAAQRIATADREEPLNTADLESLLQEFSTETPTPPSR